MEQARKLWLTEKDLYEECSDIIKNELKEVFKSASIPVVLLHRTKKDENLLKKMLSKNKSYSEINDKAGVRAVVHFLSDLELADNLIQYAFKDRIVKRDSKIETSDEKTFGYLSIHYDIISYTFYPPINLRITIENSMPECRSELAHILCM